MIDSIRLTNTEKDLLIRIKRKTGIESWNIICRWALLVGLSQNEILYRNNPEKRDAIEIRWDTFTGSLKPFINSILAHQFNAFSKANHHVEVSDYIHSRIETGIRILSNQCTKKSLLIFRDILYSTN